MLKCGNLYVSFLEIVLTWILVSIFSGAEGQITITTNITQPSCFNHLAAAGGTTGNGVIIASTTGGTPPYSYLLESNSALQTNGYFPGLSAGTYSVIVTDALGQTKTLVVTLTDTDPQPILQPDILKLPSTCTSADGSLTLDPSGGTPPYTYSLDGGKTYQAISPTISNLQEGFYIFYCKDANGCLAAAITSQYSPFPDYFFCSQCQMQMNGGESTACSNDGTLSAWVLTGGTPPFQYSQNGINFQPPNNGDHYTITNLNPGFYTIYAKDSTGLVVATVYTIAQDCYTQITFVGVDASCGQSDGSLAATANYGTPPYTYTIDGINFQLSNVFTGLATGGYTVTAKDASGEMGSAPAWVYNKCPTVSVSETNEICGQNNGTITAIGFKGTTPYQFSIDGINFQSGNLFNGLTAGTYTITITDANGFKDSTYAYIYNDCIQIAVSTVASTCGKPNGTLSAIASNGLAPYQYSIDGVNFLTDSLFTGLASGAYTITVKDASGLINSSSANITAFPAPLINATSTIASCQNTGASINIATNGGTPPFLYSMDSGNQFQSSNIFLNLDSGEYPLQVKDSNGCIADTVESVTALPTPTVFLGNDTTLCSGQIMNLFAPQLAGYQYLWQDNSTNDNTVVTTGGMYWVKLTNQFNCSASDTINVTYKPVPIFTLGNDTVLCNNKILNIKESFPGSTYLWNTGSTSSSINIQSAGLYWLQVDEAGCMKRDSIFVSTKPSPAIMLGVDTTLCTGQTLLLSALNNNATYFWQDGSTQPEFTVTDAGRYSVKVDMNGCDTSGTINVEYDNKPTVNIGDDTTICNTQKLLLDVTYPGATYQWQDGSTGSQFQVLTAGQYSVTVSNLCGTVNQSVVVKYENCACQISVPNAFTPNNDGLNDVFKPRFICSLNNYSCKIFNRWGQLIFESHNTDQGWNGYFQNQIQPSGTYVWMIQYQDLYSGKNVTKEGTIVLIR
jgi:gliding motility-associated-like protein